MQNKKVILRVDFSNQEINKYFIDSCLIKEPEAPTEEEQKILSELQRQQLSRRVIPLAGMTMKQKFEIMVQIMDDMEHMIIYEKEIEG